MKEFENDKQNLVNVERKGYLINRKGIMQRGRKP
jgi:hypothetical protein